MRKFWKLSILVCKHIFFLFMDSLGHSDSQKDPRARVRPFTGISPAPTLHNSKLLTFHDVLRQGVSKVWFIKTHREWKEQIPNSPESVFQSHVGRFNSNK